LSPPSASRGIPRGNELPERRNLSLRAYFDSGIVAKWYLPEADSAAALRVRARYAPPAVLTHLHRVELTTAWHLKVFRRESPLGTVVNALGDLEADVEAGVWEVPRCDLADVHARAESLARRHAATLGTRTLDALHVAAALCLAMEHFVTTDQRQALLAQTAGLKVARLADRR
jgi:predicted nucleic acid-binding protein